MPEKVRKTLYLPDWVVESLDVEGNLSDGPGLIAAAAIYHFCIKSHQIKKKMLKDYVNHAIEETYGCGGSVNLQDPDGPLLKTEKAKRAANREEKTKPKPMTLRDVLRNIVERTKAEREGDPTFIKLGTEDEAIMSGLRKLMENELGPKKRKRKTKGG